MRIACFLYAAVWLLCLVPFVSAQEYSDESLASLSIEEKMARIGFELYDNAKATVPFSSLDQVHLCSVQSAAIGLSNLMDQLYLLRTIYRNTTPNSPEFREQWRTIFLNLKEQCASLVFTIREAAKETHVHEYTLSMLTTQADDFSILVDEVILELLGPVD